MEALVLVAVELPQSVRHAGPEQVQLVVVPLVLKNTVGSLIISILNIKQAARENKIGETHSLVAQRRLQTQSHFDGKL